MSAKNFAKAALAVAGVSAIVGYVANKMGKNEKTIKDAVNSLASKTSVDIAEEIVEKAAEKAANNAAEKTIKNVEKTMNDQIKAGVNRVYSDVLKTTGDEFAKRAAESIDIDRLKNDVEQKAAQIIVKEFKKKIEDYGNSIFATNGVRITL